MFFHQIRSSDFRQSVLKVSEMSVYDLNDLQAKYDTLANEFQVCKCKLDSKCEALLILSKELDECRSERDQFKLMAEQLRERYQAIKRQMTGRSPRGSSHDLLDVNLYKDMETESLVQLLIDTKEVKKSLKFEVDDLKQKLNDAQGDIKLLREQIARQRVGTSDEGMNTRHFPAYEREDLVKQLEASREQYLQLEHDLQQLLDEKEDQETERDAYKSKYENLNRELNYILKGDEKRIVDIDALVAENKFLNERLKQMEEEKSMAMATASKYKSILEKKKNKGILKFGQSRSGGLVITQKQVGQMLHNPNGMPSTPQAMADLQGLCGALLDTINDKNLALSHQRKTNKLLGNRVSELEKKLKTLEVAGLWNVPVSGMTSLEKLRSECNEVKTLIPRHYSESSDTSIKTVDKQDSEDFNDIESEISSTTPSSVTSPIHQQHTVRFSSYNIHMDDLDLLPTKESNIHSKSTEDSEPTKDSSLPQDNHHGTDNDEEEESDQLLAGLIKENKAQKEKTAQKRKPSSYNKKDNIKKHESQSLLDSISCSESESSPEKQRYTDVKDYNDEDDEKIARLLTDATTRLQNKCKPPEEKPVTMVNSNTNLVSKAVPKSSLVFNIDCDFDSNANAQRDTVVQSHDNLIDMNSPEREKSVSMCDTIDQESLESQNTSMTSEELSKTSQEPSELTDIQSESVIPAIHIEEISDTSITYTECNQTNCEVSTCDNSVGCENSVQQYEHVNGETSDNTDILHATDDKIVHENCDINNIEVEFKETDDLSNLLTDDDDEDNDDCDNNDDDDDGEEDDVSEDNPGSPSKEPLLFDNETSAQAPVYPDSQPSTNC